MRASKRWPMFVRKKRGAKRGSKAKKPKGRKSMHRNRAAPVTEVTGAAL